MKQVILLDGVYTCEKTKVTCRCWWQWQFEKIGIFILKLHLWETIFHQNLKHKTLHHRYLQFNHPCILIKQLIDCKHLFLLILIKNCNL